MDPNLDSEMLQRTMVIQGGISIFVKVDLQRTTVQLVGFYLTCHVMHYTSDVEKVFLTKIYAKDPFG